MPNKPNPNNQLFSIRIPRTLYKKLEKGAKAHGMDFAAYCRHILTENTMDIQLTAEDYAKIAEEVRHAEEKRNK